MIINFLKTIVHFISLLHYLVILYLAHLAVFAFLVDQNDAVVDLCSV